MDRTFERSTATGGEPNALDSTGLCLLSLDGGGVRGLSTLYILKGIMTRLNYERQRAMKPRVKPCEIFDLIGGTSTGGIIAIMLGRLEMDVDECISAYSRLMGSIFETKLHKLPLSLKGNVQPQFDSNKLRSAIESVIRERGMSPEETFNKGMLNGCGVFVSTVSKDLYGVTRLSSYDLPAKMAIPATICEAALATSAATTFFEPVTIGTRKFVDGALGANNPVDAVEEEASNIWCPETGDLKPLVKCFISIGTGNPGKKAIEDKMHKFLGKTLVAIATETEETAKKFIARWRDHYDKKRYFRFNVEQGLQDVGLEEYKEQAKIEAATEFYLTDQERVFQVRDCVRNLKEKEMVVEENFA